MKRINEIDIAKAIGIICILIGHRTDGLIHNYVYLFHIPLFLVLSGVVMKDNKSIFSENKLLSSYIVYSVIFIIFGGFVNFINYSSFKNIAVNVYQTICLYGIHALWFLSSLWLGKILVKQIIKINNKYKELFLMLGIYTISFLISKILVNISYNTIILKLLKYIMYSFVRVGIISSFILIGYLLKKEFANIIGFYKKRNGLNIFTCILISFSLIPFVRFESIDYHLLYNGIYFLAIVYGCAGSLLVILISILINKTVFSNVFIEIGKKSLFLMTTEYFEISKYTKIMLSFIPKPFLNYASLIVYILILFIITKYLSPVIDFLIIKFKESLDNKTKRIIH